jgi:uncharacterized protein (TIGR00266 family)
MQHEIRNRPDFASLRIGLDKGEQLVTEAGAMMAMSSALKMETNMKGGLLGAAKRALGGESLFLNTYTAEADAQRLELAPSAPGDVLHMPMRGGPVMVQSGGFLAATPGVNVDSKWGGAKTFFGGEGLFMLRCSGSGDLWVSSYGAIHAIDVQGGYVVDTSHIVAFEDTLTFEVRSVGSMKSLFFSSEGLVCQFRGNGRLWMQTRNGSALAAFLHPFRRVKQQNSD